MAGMFLEDSAATNSWEQIMAPFPTSKASRRQMARMATVSSVPGHVGGSEVDEINRSVALGRSQMLCNSPTLWQRKSQKSQILKCLFKGTREPTSKAASFRVPERRECRGETQLGPSICHLCSLCTTGVASGHATWPYTNVMHRVGLGVAYPSAFSSVSLCQSL